MSSRKGVNRGISPVVGTVLMVAIVVVLATVGAAMFLGLADETDPQPNVVLEGEPTDDTGYKIVHGGGETLDGDRLELRGALETGGLDGKTLEVDDEITFYPTTREITVVWYGDNDESYTLTTVTVDRAFPEPDEGCAWVESETDNGTDPIKIDGIVVDCDVETDEGVEIQNGGVVVGDTISNLKDLDADDATVYGDVAVETVLNLQDGTITGDATSAAADVKIGNGTVDGSIEAEKVAEVINGSTVGGSMESRTKDAKVLGGSVVEGSVTAAGTVKVQDSTIEGHVYADPADFDCTNAEIDGQDCGSYTPKDPDEW